MFQPICTWHRRPVLQALAQLRRAMKPDYGILIPCAYLINNAKVRNLKQDPVAAVSYTKQLGLRSGYVTLLCHEQKLHTAGNFLHC